MGNPAMPFIIENRRLGALRPGPKLVPSNTLLRRVIYLFFRKSLSTTIQDTASDSSEISIITSSMKVLIETQISKSEVR